MPVRSLGRGHQLRRRAVPIVGSIGAPSTAASAALNIAASYYSPFEQSSTDRPTQAEEDAGEAGEGALVGGGVGGPTASSGVRVGQSVHSGQLSVGPSRSVSDPASHTTCTSTTTQPHYSTVVEAVCTVQSCSHCCLCHLRHPRNGYGRCMRTRRRPWPDCRCAGKCAPGRCAQPNCASNQVLSDVDSSNSDDESDSHSTITLSATQSQESHISCHSPDVSAAPLPSTLPTPVPGTRRAAGGVHPVEDACVGPQADTRTSTDAAYRRPSATVSDNRLAASSAVGLDGVEAATHTAGSSGSYNTGTGAGVPVGQQLPQAVLDQMPSLSHQPRRLTVIADGRCAVASVLLARGAIPDSHNTVRGRRTIDSARRQLGKSLANRWTEAEWIRRVPLHLRRDRPECGPSDGNQLRRSYSVYQQLLLRGKPTEWLDHSVFHLASEEYNIGIFVIYNAGFETHSAWFCARVGADKPQHAVLFQSRGHYECVEYDGLRLFPSDHEFVGQLEVFAAGHPEQLPEDDLELVAFEAQVAAAATVSPPPEQAASKSKRRSGSKVKRRLHVDDRAKRAPAETNPINAPCSDGVKQLPPLIAQVAVHGPLYERVSFHNQPQWRTANEPLWNAYRLASMTGQRNQLTSILDILLLPQRVLPKLGRSGRAGRRRATAATGHRLRTEAERIRARYNCPDPHPTEGQRTQMSTDTMAHTTALGGYSRPKRAASVAAAEVIRQHAADTTDAGTDSDYEEAAKSDAAADSEDEPDEPFPSFGRRNKQHTTDPDTKAARRADSLVQSGLTRKAALVLHSTTQIADQRAADAQETMLRLHPQPPSDSVLPALPEGAPPAVLEDDAGMRTLLTQSDNGSSAGPSGWGGNMLSILAHSDICRLGVTALLRDIINGDMPDDARQLLLTSRLVALTKPNSDGYRPIAVGELFYRLAAIVAVRRVSDQAATLLAPHQYGIGVAAGAEKILHSLQHELADSDKRLALLQLDIANAFNTCDRARMLSELYGLTDLQPLFRLVDFAYSQPSALVLTGCEGLMIASAQGVRQGDPLSALLFCVYMRDVLRQVSDETSVEVYGFFDDVHLLGTPQQLMAALSHLQKSLPAVSLQLNTAKSHFVYFHDRLTPLTATVCRTLSTNDIQLHHEWAGVVGAVVGKDDAAIRSGMQRLLSAAGNYDTFLRRLQLDDMPLDTALLLLRQCMVPAMSYFLRCIAPVCIEEEARRFDQRMMDVAMNKLGLDSGERNEQTATLLQRKLREGGGWGLTPAARTSPAAFLGSLATCHAESTFAPYCGTTLLPASSLLHGWVDDSLQRVRRAASGDEYHADIEPKLPATADDFFGYYSAAKPSDTTQLQRSLNAKATSHNLKAAVVSMKEKSRRGDKFEYAHHRAVTAKGACGWKIAQPRDLRPRLSDVEYAVAARLNLALPPFPAPAMSALPNHCPLCRHSRTGALVSLQDDPWHFLVCTGLSNGELSYRHDAVVKAIAHVARMVGAQVREEVTGLDAKSAQRPDLQIVFPGRMLLTDVVVSHSLTATRCTRRATGASLAAVSWQSAKNKKYAAVASRIGAELLNMSLDTSGGMASDAVRLVKVIGEEGERWSAGTWTSSAIERQLLGAIAAAVQRGNALAMLTGYTRATAAVALGGWHSRLGARDGDEAEVGSGAE